MISKSHYLNAALGCLLSFIFCAAGTALVKHFVSYLGYLFFLLCSILGQRFPSADIHVQYSLLTGTLIKVKDRSHYGQ